MKQENYDVIVVGGGTGGMSAAALLVNAGYNVLVAERLPFLGGRASSYHYNGYTISSGAFYIEMGGGLEEIFREVGAKFEVTFCPTPKIRIKGKDYLLPEKGQMRAAISIAARDEAEADRVWKVIKRGLSWKEPSLATSFDEWLRQYTDNPAILGIFRRHLATVLGTAPEEMPAGGFFGFLHAMGGFSSSGFPPGGNVTIWQSLQKVIEAKGGTIWTRCSVRRIMVEDGVVQGVKMERDGTDIQIAAKVVISNVGPKMTVKMAGEENFERGYLKEVDALMPVPFYVVVVASDEPLYDYPGGVGLTETRRLTLMMCPTLVRPDYAPPGKHMLWACSIPPAPLYDNQKEMELIIEDLEDNLPGFTKYGKVLTSQSFVGEWPGYRIYAGRDISQKTPVENLYNVGDAARPWGWIGVPGCAVSARQAVNDIKKRFKPEARISWPK